MSITVIQQPPAVYPAHSKTILECYDSTYTDVDYYIVTLGSETFKVEPNISGRCYIDIRKITAANMESELSQTGSYDNIKSVYAYYLTVGSFYEGEVSAKSTGYLGTKTALNMCWQDNDPAFVYNDFLAGTDAYGKWLNKYSGGLSVPLDGDLTIEYLGVFGSGSNLSGIYVKVYNKDWKVEGDETVTAVNISSGSSGVHIVDVSPKMLNSVDLENPISANITEDTMYYVIEAQDNELEPIRVNVEQEDGRYPKPTRLSYINSFGATDYFTFKLADENNLAISKNTYNSNGVEKDYSTEVIKTRNLIGNYTSEKRIDDLSDLWYSPIVYSITDGAIVRVTNKSVTINKRRNNKQFTPTATIKFANEFRTIQQ